LVHFCIRSVGYFLNALNKYFVAQTVDSSVNLLPLATQ
jgi:hypothetical protein